MNVIYACQRVTRIALLAADEKWGEWLDSPCLFVVLEGKGRLEIDGTDRIAGKGSIWYCGSKQMVRIKAGYELVIVQIAFHILERRHEEGQALAYGEYEGEWLPDGEVSLQAAYPLERVVKEMLTVPEPEAEEGSLKLNLLLYEVLHSLREAKGKREDSSPSSSEDSGIGLAVAYMQQHYSEELTRDAMAAMTGFHPGVFSKLFKEETGSGFSEYLADIRIEKAKEQLLLTDHNLNTIAQDIGYSNGLYLSRKFKQITGVSPKGYLKRPKRIVIYDWVGNLLALGEKPVGASYYKSLSLLTLHKRELEGVVDVGNDSIEAVTELKPELIVTTSWQRPELNGSLQKIAPTLIVPYGDPLLRFRELAATLSKQEQAESFIEKYQRRAAEVKAQIGDLIKPDETVGLYEPAADSVWVFSEFHGRGGYNLYRTLGFKPPASISKLVMGKGMIRQISVEQLPAYAADHMFISYPFQTEGRSFVESFMKHSVWQNIPAYGRNRIYFLDRGLFHSSDALSLYKQLELQRRAVCEAINGQRQPGDVFVHETDDFYL